MAATSNSQAIGIANTLLGLVSSLYNNNQNIIAICDQYTTLAAGTVFNGMNTTALLADGTLGIADPSGSPVSGHVIDTRVYPSLTRAIAATDLATIVTLLQAVSQLLSGGTPPTQQGEAPQIMAKVVGQ